MIYKKFYLVIILYLAAMLILSMAFAFNVGKDITYAIISAFFLILITIGFASWLNRLNKKLAYFFSAVRNEDSTLFFHEGEGFANEVLLNKSLNDLNARLKTAKINIELQEKFYKSIMEKIRTGIISFYDNGVVEFTNPEFRKMFALDQVPHINRLRSIDPKLFDLLLKIESGQQERINVKVNHNLLSLAVYSQSIILQKSVVKIVTLQDIKNELDIHEMESWQKLIRILNHEIMNSVAPITSLSSTISGFYKTGKKQRNPDSITPEIISDTIRGLNIIEDHGKGLIHFVESYRSLTQLPKPEFARVNINEFYERITILANSNFVSYDTLYENRPVIKSLVDPELTVVADDKLLAQVFLNIIKNSVEAFDKSGSGNEIVMEAYKNPEGRIIFTVKDNGAGMNSETLEKIFIPFFTTKQSGSGIGLSLSRQILRLHNGSISCESVPGQGTTITLAI